MEAYNCRLYSYPTCDHVTFYHKAIIRKKDTISKSRSNEKNKNENEHEDRKERTEEEKAHCKKVSTSRTKNMIYNIARSNRWEWFITLTFDREKTDASDYDIVTRRLQNFLTNLQQRQCPNLIYLIVPEMHADKTHYHFHGLLSGCEGLHFCYSGHDTKGGEPIYNIRNWTWGFTTATQVKDTARAFYPLHCLPLQKHIQCHCPHIAP